MENNDFKISRRRFVKQCDTFFDNEIVYQRLKNRLEQYGKIIICTDVDDTLRETNSNYSCKQTRELLRRWQKSNRCWTIIYSSNPNIDSLKQFLREEEIHYDAFNENLPFIKNENNGSIKVYYNIFLDDKAGLKETYNILLRLADEIGI